MGKFPFRKTFLGNLNESILANAIASSGFPQKIFLNPFVSCAPFLYPLKTSVGVDKGSIASEWVKRKLRLNGNNEKQFNKFHVIFFSRSQCV